MNYRQFKGLVKGSVNQEDYQENSEMLCRVDGVHYELYIKALTSGANMLAAEKIVKELLKITIDYNITTDEAFKLMLRLRLIDVYLDGKTLNENE
jgi:hypothetical protein